MNVYEVWTELNKQWTLNDHVIWHTIQQEFMQYHTEDILSWDTKEVHVEEALEAILEDADVEYEYVRERDLEVQFEEYLDEICEPWIFDSYHYAASDLLKAIDTIAYRENYSNWIDSQPLVLLEGDTYIRTEEIE